MEYQIKCGAKPSCGFVVGLGYYREKRRFVPGLCARCNAEVRVVEAFTDTDVPFTMDTNPASPTSGRVTVGLPF